MVPSHRFAIVSLTNAEPNGPLFNRRIRDWALEHDLGLVKTDPLPKPRDTEALRTYAGHYANGSALVDVAVEGDHLLLTVAPSPEFVAQLGDDADYVEPPIPLRMLPDTDRYIVTEGSHHRERGFFTRDPDTDEITGIHLHGRYVPRSS
jgi:hypothetical protein